MLGGTALFGIAGIGVSVILLTYPAELAHGPLARLLGRYGGVELAGNLSPEAFERYLRQQLQEAPRHRGLLPENRRKRILQALRAMNEPRARNLPPAGWSQLLNHHNVEVRQTAPRTSREYGHGTT